MILCIFQRKLFFKKEKFASSGIEDRAVRCYDISNSFVSTLRRRHVELLGGLRALRRRGPLTWRAGGRPWENKGGLRRV